MVAFILFLPPPLTILEIYDKAGLSSKQFQTEGLSVVILGGDFVSWDVSSIAAKTKTDTRRKRLSVCFNSGAAHRT